MGNFNETKMDGVYVIEPGVFKDEKGYCTEMYNKKQFLKAGINMIFVQEFEFESKKGMLKGIHFQKQYNQGSLIKVTKGEGFIVAVDLRYGSLTFGKWESFILNEENKKQVYIPEGFAHGFLTLSDEAIFNYKCTEFYDPEDNGGIMWNDPDINIKWPLEKIENVILSERDKLYPRFKDLNLKKYPQIYKNKSYYC
ncbi:MULTISPECIES: dTDP-4-dehydrorhamnose 3,5-epimerase [unclassified Clostridium]|uniref:dTDP-4-dehydrorhamnose 3,5-epimerase n=1 Tax=unclassified Clostridium TaxID=2614128 RepID=UPI00030A562B|nr:MULTISPECIES: dTDP-4-dehydrorhamnose 3,5-epimerase [unclassified Clostridium]